MSFHIYLYIYARENMRLLAIGLRMAMPYAVCWTEKWGSLFALQIVMISSSSLLFFCSVILAALNVPQWAILCAACSNSLICYAEAEHFIPTNRKF